MEILARLWPKIKDYRSLYRRIRSKDFLKILQDDRARLVDKNYWSEVSKKNPLVGQMGNFDPIVSQNNASLYVRIRSKDFFKLCSMIGHNK